MIAGNRNRLALIANDLEVWKSLSEQGQDEQLSQELRSHLASLERIALPTVTGFDPAYARDLLEAIGQLDVAIKATSNAQILKLTVPKAIKSLWTCVERTRVADKYLKERTPS